MGYIVRMPKLGMEMEEGTVLSWHVSEGDDLKEGTLIAEVESEKTVGEIEAREDGVIRRIALEEGATGPPGEAMGIIAEEDENISDLEAEIEQGKPVPEKTETGTEEMAADEQGEATTTSPEASPQAKTEVKSSPRAEERAAELGVDLTRVEGTGPGGAITEEDVDAAARATPETEVGGARRTVTEAIEFGGMRRTIADRLTQSARNAVHVTEHRTVDAEALLEAAEAVKEGMETSVSMPDLLLLAISATLDEHPAFNATYEDETHTIYEEHNLGLAVDIEEGLIAPVLPDVGEKGLSEIADERRQITERARSGDYTMDDLAGGTFTITNLGVLGVEAFDPIINPPQVAILGINAIEERAARADQGIEFRQKLPFSLSFDHRVVDGADAARFLQTLSEHVEDPWPLLPSEVRAATD